MCLEVPRMISKDNPPAKIKSMTGRLRMIPIPVAIGATKTISIHLKKFMTGV